MAGTFPKPQRKSASVTEFLDVARLAADAVLTETTQSNRDDGFTGGAAADPSEFSYYFQRLNDWMIRNGVTLVGEHRTAEITVGGAVDVGDARLFDVTTPVAFAVTYTTDSGDSSNTTIAAGWAAAINDDLTAQKYCRATSAVDVVTVEWLTGLQSAAWTASVTSDPGTGDATAVLVEVVSGDLYLRQADDDSLGGILIGSASTEGASTRLFFDVTKGAFRAGAATGTEWDDANRGAFSIALGLDSVASAANAFSTQGGAASGSAAIALGSGSSASAAAAMAGPGATASGDRSIAMGLAAAAVGADSLAIGAGANTTVAGNDAIALGDGATASASDSVAIGSGSTASGGSAVSVGKNSTAAAAAAAVGFGADAGGSGSAAVGQSSGPTGSQSLSVGYASSAAGSHGAAIGHSAVATLDNSLAIGEGADVGGLRATAIGYLSNALGTGAAAIGVRANASANASLAIGVTDSTSVPALASASQAIAVGVGSSIAADSALADAVGAIAIGRGSAASAIGSAVGDYALCYQDGQEAFSGHALKSASPVTTDRGASQIGRIHKMTQTADATVTVLGGGTVTVEIPNGMSVWVEGVVIAMDVTNGKHSAWNVEFGAKQIASTVTIAGVSVSAAKGDAVTVGVALSNPAVVAGDGVKIAVTGAASTDINWICRLRTTEIKSVA